MFQAEIKITLKAGVLDPQGETVKSSLGAMGFKGVDDVRVGKLITLTVAGNDREAAHAEVADMCERLLANPVIEKYDFTLAEVSEV